MIIEAPLWSKKELISLTPFFLVQRSQKHSEVLVFFVSVVIFFFNLMYLVTTRTHIYLS